MRALGISEYERVKLLREVFEDNVTEEIERLAHLMSARERILYNAFVASGEPRYALALILELLRARKRGWEW